MTTVYTCVVQTGDPNWFCAAVSPSIFCAGFPFYKVTDKGRAATHQLYSFDIEVGFAPMEATALGDFDCYSSNRITRP